MTDGTIEPLLSAFVVASVTGWHNALHLTPARWRQLVVTAGVGLAGLAGAVWLFTAVDPERGLGAVWAWTSAAAVVSISLVLLGRVVPAVARMIADRRIAEMSPLAFVTHTLVRIPILTALAEEILFRGVVWIVLAQVGGTTFAWVWSSVAFALAHVVVGRQQARREGYPVVRWLSGTLLTTLLAGFGLGYIRIVTEGIWAAAGVHAVVNVVFAVGARWIATRDRDATSNEIETAGERRVTA